MKEKFLIRSKSGFIHNPPKNLLNFDQSQYLSGGKLHTDRPTHYKIIKDKKGKEKNIYFSENSKYFKNVDPF